MIIPGFLKEEVAIRLAQRLHYMKLEPAQVLDFTGHDAGMLQQRFAGVSVVSGVGSRVPGATGLIYSNLHVWQEADLLPTFQAWQHFLAEDGAILFCTIGRMVVESSSGVGSRVSGAFLDMHHIGDALLEAGFADPVMDSEVLTLKYKTQEKLAEDFPAVASEIEEQMLSVNLELELVYAIAWNQPVKKTASVNQAGEVVIPIQNIQKKES